MSAKMLSILVPVYNEAKTLEHIMRRVLNVAFPIEREVVVIDDGSTDGSREVLDNLHEEGLIRYYRHKANRGKGAAVATALRHARGDVVVVQDADLELDPEDLPRLLEPILSGETQVCYGTRFAPPIPSAYKRLPTYWANRILNFLSNRINGIRITDFNTCYKMVTSDVMSMLGIAESGFSMEAEITAKIAKSGYRIVERPISYAPRSFSDGKKIRLRDVARYLIAMVRYRFLWSVGSATPATLQPASISSPGIVVTAEAADVR